jgi:superfamily II DNA or RNA helicase/intein/homing endonuclease
VPTPSGLPTLDEIQSEMIESIMRSREAGLKSAILEAATGVGKCLDPDTFVWSGGLKRFGDIFGVAERIEGPFGLASIAGWYDDGTRPGFKVTLDCGIEIDGTPAHRIWTRTTDGIEGWTYLSDLTEDHYVAIARGHADFGPNVVPPDEAYALGLLIADGCFVKCPSTERIQLDKQRPVMERIAEVLERWRVWAGGNGRGAVRINDISENHANAIIHAPALASMLRDRYGIEALESSDKRTVPKAILEGTKETVAWFLRGYFDGDGYCCGMPAISTSSERLARQVHQLLFGLGVYAGYRSKTTVGLDAHIIAIRDLEAFEREVGLTDYGLTKDRSYRELLAKDRNPNSDVVPGVGHLIRIAAGGVPKKQSRRDAWRYAKAYYDGTKMPGYSTVRRMLDAPDIPRCQAIEDLKQIANENRAWCKVRTIEDSTISRIDCEVSIQHAFIGNGVVNHNTITAAKYIKRLRDGGSGKALFVVDERKLAVQTEDKFTRWGLKVAVEMGDRKARDAMAMFGGVDVVVATRQTLAGRRILGWDKYEFTNGIVDEVHTVNPEGGQSLKIIEHFEGIKFWLGLSATPYRMDGKPLVPSPFETVCDRKYRIAEAIANGHLVPITFVECSTGVNLRAIKIVKTKNGRDFDPTELDERISQNVDTMANAARMEINRLGLKHVLHFASSVPTAIAFATAYNQIGIRARAIHGDSPDKEEIFRQFEDGELPIMVGMNMFNKGFDAPRTDGLIMGRPTKSKGLAWQQLGRGTRTCPETGKERLHVIGFHWECDKEGPISTLDLFLEEVPDPRTRDIAKSLMRSRKEADVQDVVRDAEEIREAERKREEAERLRKEKEKERKERSKQARIAARKRDVSYRRREFDPIRVAVPTLQAIPTDRMSHRESVPENVASVLKDLGVGGADSLDPETAMKTAQFWLDRTFLGLTSAKQIGQLMSPSFGYTQEQAMRMTAKEANQIIGRRFGQWRSKA